MVIYLSPSTQEGNIGALGYSSEEVQMNEICNILQAELVLYNHEIYRNSPSMSIEEIVVDSNYVNPDIHIAIHSNAYNGKARGALIFCHKYGGNGHRLAQSIYKYIEELTPTSDKGIIEGYNYYNGEPMYELAYTTAPAVLLEIDFHDNPLAAQWIMEHRLDIAVAIAKGVNDYAGIETKKIVPEITKYDMLISEMQALLNKYREME